MPDFIERTIYKMELDDSNYIRGVDRMATNTARLSQQQVESNRRLQETQNILRTSQTALDNITVKLTRYRVELQNATGRNTGIQRQYEQEIPKLEAEHAKLTQTVLENKKAYEEAAQAATRFSSAAAQQPTGRPPLVGGGISPIIQPQAPIGPIVPAGVSQELRTLIDQIREIRSEDISNVFDVAAGEMEAFRAAIEEAEIALEGMVGTEKEFNEEFKNLAIVVSEGSKIIEEFDKQTAQAATSSLSYRQQITNLNKELKVLESTHGIQSRQYQDKLAEVGSLTNKYKDQQAAIRALSSETKVLDFGRGAITAATSAFQAYTSIAILAGGASEDLQKKTFQLFAAMQLITSLEQLHVQLKKLNVLATAAQIVAQRAYTAVVGATTGALRALRVAMLSLPIAGLVAGIALLVLRFRALGEAQREFVRQTALVRQVNEQAARSVGEQVARLIIFRDRLNDLNTPAKERVKIAKEYNETAEETNKIDTKQIDNLELINQKITAQNKLILDRAVALAATQALGEKASEFVESQLEIGIIAQRAGRDVENLIVEAAALRGEIAAITGNKQAKDGAIELTNKEERAYNALIKRYQEYLGLTRTEIERLLQLVPVREKARKELEEANKTLAPLISNQGLVTPPPPPPPARTIENVFEQERKRLLDRLQQLRNEELQGVQRINAEFTLKIDQERARIAKLLEDKRVTARQAEILIRLAVDINKQELDRALEEFNKTVIDKREKLNQALRDLQLKNLTDSINLIQDEFNRRAALIDLNEQKELESSRNIIKERLEALQALGEETGTTGFQEFQIEKNRIVQEGQNAETNIVRRAAQERQQLAFDSFKQTLEFFDRAITEGKLIGDKAALAEIQELTRVFQSGAIKYEDYKKRLAAIQKKYEDAQLQLTIDNLQAELRALQARATFAFNLTEQQYNELLELIRRKEAEIIAAQTRQTIASGTATGEGQVPPQVETVADYAEAIGQLTQSIINFWLEANRAEQEALDRSIAIQERRVSEAIKIAERGNASYLKMEEDRLNQLRVARENAARRELAINAAIQASQLLVGITGAIAKIASGIGVAQTIAEIAVIVSSLAAGFALVRTLQNNQPRFAGGEKYVRRKEKEPAGTDTVQAWLTEGEAVISKDKNKEYHPVISAIHDGTVPASYLNKQIERYHDYKHEVNNFTKSVEKYHTIKSVPSINYDRVKKTAELHINADGKLAALISDQNRKIDENNDLQRQTLMAMRNMSIEATMDKDGIAISVNEHLKQLQINKFI